jgi:ribosomal protein L12E/L44/L45/RPP1/RPP2
MATLEQVEKLREKANVSFEEAKTALDASNGDLLEAIILLEKQGKVNPPVGGGFYCSNNSGAGEKETAQEERKTEERRGESFSEMINRFGRFCGRVINKGNTNYFEAEKEGKVIISLPVTLLVISVIFFFWFIFPLMIVGLFFGFRYHFRGHDLGKESVNKVMDSASDTAENIKRSFNNDKK